MKFTVRSLFIIQSFRRRKNSDLSLKMGHNSGLPRLIRTGFQFSLHTLADAKLSLEKKFSRGIITNIEMIIGNTLFII